MILIKKNKISIVSKDIVLVGNKIVEIIGDNVGIN